MRASCALNIALLFEGIRGRLLLAVLLGIGIAWCRGSNVYKIRNLVGVVFEANAFPFPLVPRLSVAFMTPTHANNNVDYCTYEYFLHDSNT